MSVALDALYETLDARTIDILERRRGATGVKRRGWIIRRALLSADVLALFVAFLIAEFVYPVQMNRAGSLSPLTEILSFALAVPAWIVAAKLYGLYDKDEERADHATADDFSGVFHLVTVCAWLLYAASLLTDWFNPQFGKLFVFWLFAVVGITLLRASARAYCRRQVHYLQNTVIVGAGEVGQAIAKKLLKHPEYGINLVGFIDSHPTARARGLAHLTLLGGTNDLLDLVSLLDIERVVFAFSNDSHETSLDLIRKLNECDVQVDIVPRFFEVLSPGVDLHSVEGLLMCGLRPGKLARSSRLIKRGVDLAASLVGLVLLAPAFAIIAVAIKADSPGPVFFRQVRMGERDRVFRIWKFRTMALDAEARKLGVAHLNKHLAPGGDPRMFKIDDDPRVTRVGRILRQFSIDELPQLLNVASGDMSLVGPRPLILEEDEHVKDWGVRRLDLRPGITGLWQVLGRDQIPFEDMVRLDYQYVTTWSLLADLRILCRTLPVLFRDARATG